MTFTSGIPASGQSLGASRTLVAGNFSNYNTVISVNHVAPNLAGQGKHKFCQFPEQAASPGTAANEAAFYSKVGAVSGVTELFFQREGLAAAGADIQMTIGDPVASGSNGSTFLPGGMVLKWGTGVGTGATTASVTFATAFPSAGGFRVGYAIMNNVNLTIQVVSVTQTDITVRGFLGTLNAPIGVGQVFFWFAIGN